MYGVELVKAAERYLSKYAGDPEITMAGFQAKFKLNLVFTALDLTDAKVCVFSATTSPNLPVKYAMRMAAGLACYFPAIFWQGEWGRYLGDDVSGHKFVDNYLLYPLNPLQASPSF